MHGVASWILSLGYTYGTTKITCGWEINQEFIAAGFKRWRCGMMLSFRVVKNQLLFGQGTDIVRREHHLHSIYRGKAMEVNFTHSLYRIRYDETFYRVWTPLWPSLPPLIHICTIVSTIIGWTKTWLTDDLGIGHWSLWIGVGCLPKRDIFNALPTGI